MEKISSSFRCILETARLQWSKLGSLFPEVPMKEKRFFFCFFIYYACVWTAAGSFFTYYLLRIFPYTTIRFSENSPLSQVVLDGSSTSHETVYFFNITNAEDFLERGEALNVREVGPYVYRVWTERRDRVWDNEKQTLSYNEVRHYDFHAKASKGSLDDEIITWNGPFIIVAESLKKSNRSFRQEFLSSLNFTVHSVIVEKKVKELVFGHYRDDLMQKASLAHLNVPFKDGTFSWLDKHRTKNRVFTISTASSDPGIVKGFNGRDKLNVWNGGACNKIDGTFGKIMPPVTSRHHSSFFIPDLCRSFTFPLMENYGYEHVGIYRVTKKTLANSTENPDNYCFETRGTRPSGVYSVSSCSSGAPLWISFPHFHLGDPSYTRDINGLHANESIHGSYFKVNEFFGLALEMKLSTQINIEVAEICDIFPFNSIPKRIYPILWSTIQVKEKDTFWMMNFIIRALDIFIYDLFLPVYIFIDILIIVMILVKLVSKIASVIRKR